MLPENTILYATMEPCLTRKSGNSGCTQKILELRKTLPDGTTDKGKKGPVTIKAVYVGIREPKGVFVPGQDGLPILEEKGVKVVVMEDDEDLKKQIWEVTWQGHDNPPAL